MASKDLFMLHQDNSPVSDDAQSPACFSRCYKAKTVCRCLPVYKFRSKFDSIICCLLVSLVTALLIGLIVPLLLNDIVNQQIHAEIVVDSTDAKSFDSWQTNTVGDGLDIDISYDVYVFDYQNLPELLNKSKPVLVQNGPYHFREYYNKFDIEFTDDGDTVSYNNQKFYIFDQAGSGAGLSLNDRLTIPYVTIIGFEWLLRAVPAEANDMFEYYLHTEVFGPVEAQLAYEYENAHGPRKDMIASVLSAIEVLEADLYRFVESAPPGNGLLKTLMCITPLGEAQVGITPFWKVDPVTAYFGWLNDPILTTVQKLLISMNESTATWTTAVPGVSTNWTTVDDVRRRRAPDMFKTGKKDGRETGQYVRYANQSSQYICLVPMDSPQADNYVEGEMFPACHLFQNDWTPEQAESYGYTIAYATDYANRIQGTDASTFGHPMTTEKLAVYISDIYRSAFLEQVETVEDWYDVPLKRFQLQEKDLWNVTLWPPAWQWGTFGPSGMENMTYQGVPAFASLPHFLEGDSCLAGSVIGLSPDAAVHQTMLDIEPNTGLTARAYKRLQLNYYMADNYLPRVNVSTVALAAAACGNYSLITKSNLTCHLWDKLFSCLSIPTDWKYHDGGVYMPYAWVEESVVFNEDTADGIKEINAAVVFAYQVQLWCFVVGGLLFAMIVGLMYGKRLNDGQSKLPSSTNRDLTNPLIPSDRLTDQLVYDCDNRGTGNGLSMKEGLPPKL